MALGTITLTADLDSSGRWVLLTLTCTGATGATIYRVTADGTQAVRGAFEETISGALNAADYEAPQNQTLTYFARVTDGTSTQESTLVTVAGVVDRGGDCIFGLTNPLGIVAVNVVGVPELRSQGRQDVVQVIGRADPVVVSDVRLYPSGTLTVATLTDDERQDVTALLADGQVIAFSPRYADYGFSDIWYLAVSNVTEKRVSALGNRPERFIEMEFQRVAPPPADFVGPAFQLWQDVLDAGTSWNTVFTSGATWLSFQVA
jgi:hypothetical protein